MTIITQAFAVPLPIPGGEGCVSARPQQVGELFHRSRAGKRCRGGQRGQGLGSSPARGSGAPQILSATAVGSGRVFNKARGERIALGVGEAFQTPGWKNNNKKKIVCFFCSVDLRHEFNMALGETLLPGRRRWQGFPLRPTANLGSFSFLFIYLFRRRGRGIF